MLTEVVLSSDALIASIIMSPPDINALNNTVHN